MQLEHRTIASVSFLAGLLAAAGWAAGCGGDVQIGSGGAAGSAAAGGTTGHGGALTTTSAGGAGTGGFAGSTFTGGQAGDIIGTGGCTGAGQCPPGTYCNDFSSNCFQS